MGHRYYTFDAYVWPGATGVASRHHFVNSGLFTSAGLLNLRAQVSCGIMVHSWLGFSLGTSLVWNWQVFWGVQVAHLLWDVDEGSDGLVVALLRALLSDTPSTADLHRELLTAGVT